MASHLIEHVFKIICLNFGVILMFYYGVMGVKLKQVVQIWLFEIKAVKIIYRWRRLFNKSNIFLNKCFAIFG